MRRQFFVYIMTNYHNTVLYTGITNNLKRRVLEDKNKINKCFTSRYNIKKLVYFEIYSRPLTAIAREKQIKAGSRRKKIILIQSINPEWHDLYDQL